jgi:hypothetical protein
MTEQAVELVDHLRGGRTSDGGGLLDGSDFGWGRCNAEAGATVALLGTAVRAHAEQHRAGEKNSGSCQAR